MRLKTLKIREEIHQKLKALGKKDQTFSDIIENLINISGYNYGK